MKKTTFSLAFLLIFLWTGAQDFKQIRNSFILAQASSDSKLEEVKNDLDKLLVDPKAQNKPEGFALKAEIYGSIAGNEMLKSKYPNAAAEAYEALQKYLKVDPKEEIIKNDGYLGISSIYSAYYMEGVKFYNDSKWEDAYLKFKTTVEVSELFNKRKWSTTPIDSMAYLLAGASAQNASRNEEAVKYYTKLADFKIKAKDYESLYDFLPKYYLGINDKSNFEKYLSISKELYPENTIWSILEFTFATEHMPSEEVAKKYDDAKNSNSLSASNYMDYGEYFLNNKSIKALELSKRSLYTEMGVEAFAKASEIEPGNGIASYNAGIAAYSVFDEANEIARKIVGATAEIKARRQQVYKASDAAADKSIAWLEKSYAVLETKPNRTSIEKNCINKTVDILYNLYEYKKDRSRGVTPKDYDKYEGKAKFYDSKHNKF